MSDVPEMPDKLTREMLQKGAQALLDLRKTYIIEGLRQAAEIAKFYHLVAGSENTGATFCEAISTKINLEADKIQNTIEPPKGIKGMLT